jgi:glycerol uptake facilitator protein
MSFWGPSFDDCTNLFLCLHRGSFNPARDFGPRLVTALAHWGAGVAFTDFLPYLMGPIFGGPIGAFFADKMLML